MWSYPFFAHNICLHAYIHFVCLIQIQNTEIYTVYRKSAKKIPRYEFLLISPSPNMTATIIDLRVISVAFVNENYDEISSSTNIYHVTKTRRDAT